MGVLTRAYDWAKSPLGPSENWPQSLRVAIRLMLNSRRPMLIWWGPELIQFYNDAYIPLMEPGRHPAALGGRGRDFCADLWDLVGPRIDYVMAGKGSTWEEDRLLPVTRNGRRENAWWSYSYDPIDVEGVVGGVFVICNEVTKQHLANEASKDQARSFSQLFELSHSFMAILRGPDHVFAVANAALARLIGDRDFIGKPVREIVPEVEAQGFLEALDRAYQTGKAYVGTRTRMLVKPDAGGPPKEAFVDIVIQPMVEANGDISGILIDGVDVTDAVRAEQHLQLMNAELSHRAKNTLSIVNAIASQTFHENPIDVGLETFQNRLAALAKAQDILTATGQLTAPVRDVVEHALAPHHPGPGRISVSGPHIIVGAKQVLALGLAIHELATNAIKYGALSNDRGQIDISWSEELVGGLPIFRFSWLERYGPPVKKPLKKGFGSGLIEGGLAWDFGGRVEVSYEPSGFICRLTAPKGSLGWPIAPVPAPNRRSAFGERRQSTLEPTG